MKTIARIVMCLVATAAGCTSDTELRLPIAEAERARELKLLAEPPVIQITRAEYTASVEKDVRESADYDQLRRDAYGRLGFFPRDYDTASAAGNASAYYGAIYSQEAKTITIIDSSTSSLLVHELTHALQDQHFDLKRLLATSMSSDESLAKRALIEGDAVIAQTRYELWARGKNPTSAIAEYITETTARGESDRILEEANVPLLFVARQSFAYTFGVAYVARRLDIAMGTWSYGEVNALFAGSGPASTQEVLHPSTEPDPIVPTGFGTLPAAVAAEYDVAMVDRLGEWYAYLLFRPGDANAVPPAGNVPRAVALEAATAKWDGDQLVLLRRKDRAASGIVWTSIWETESAAERIEAGLRRVHGDAVSSVMGSPIAPDGELIRIERRGNQVCFVKNFDPTMMELLARVALSTKEEKRMEILHVVATTPNVH